MRTLNLDEAAIFLKIPTEHVISKVESGILPGAKLNNDFIFIDVDLVTTSEAITNLQLIAPYQK